MSTAGLDCWNSIGIAGDRSCRELEAHIHCRNCPVFASAAEEFLHRVAPEGYLSEWALALAAPVEPTASKDISMLIFRLGDEWLALRTQVIVEVTTPRPVHKIPHRSNETLIGMVNLRGRLQLQISMHGLLGVGSKTRATNPRLVVIRREGQTWAFEAEEVLGVHRFARTKLRTVPSTLANPTISFSQAVVDWKGRSVGFLDPSRVFEALRGLGQ